jgi:hypothetical protein
MTTNVIRRLANGVIPQAVIAGSLSFSHIHDLANAHGQTKWKAWTYPLSVDLLTVAAYRNVRERWTHPVVAWFWFLLSIAASLTANVIATGGKDVISISVGVWPSVAFLGCTFLGHTGSAEGTDSSAEVESSATDDVAPAEVITPQPAEVVPTSTAVTGPVPEEPAARPVTVSGPAVEVAPALLEFAARVAADHERQHGEPIDLATLRQRLGVNQQLSEAVLMRLRDSALATT